MSGLSANGEMAFTSVVNVSIVCIEVLQDLVDGLGTAEIAASRSTTAQVIKNTRTAHARS
jgi:DNA/RNA endonuclease YhcR with UshA esterase domain